MAEMNKPHVKCPHCDSPREVTPYTVAYRVRQFEQVRVTCAGCGQQFKILADIKYITEK